MPKENEMRDVMSDEQLLSSVSAGEVALFAVLMKRYNQKFYRIARSMGVPDAECDDVIQQTYIQVYLKLPQFRGDSSARTWITRILINQCLMLLRKKRPTVSITGELEDFTAMKAVTFGHTPESEMIQQELRALLEQKIDALPADFRTVYVMREVEDMKVRDIASSLGISESNVKVRLHRARKLLQQGLHASLKPFELYTFGSRRCDALTAEVLSTIRSVL